MRLPKAIEYNQTEATLCAENPPCISRHHLSEIGGLYGSEILVKGEQIRSERVNSASKKVLFMMGDEISPSRPDRPAS